MDIIRLLPDNVANRIAAGEVIQRPASVIKELVENAIDAGAHTIKILVVDAGKTSIQVIDDGCGMTDTDARLSFERHATSKIRTADDLFALHTMGFRGEALASIAAVAQVTLQTRKKGAELGTKICTNGDEITSQEPVVCPEGSNFLIENLFFNVPARRKFLKSNPTEMSNITQAFVRIVLVYPEIEFVLYNNGQETLRLRATTLRQRILDVFGKRINKNLLPLETKTTLCNIKGFVGKPESARKKRMEQFFFVNGRYMKHPYFHKAILSAFERLIPAGEQIPYFIYFDVNPEDIDVNVHPVKTEIKFENEQAIWRVLMAAVFDAVGKFSEIPSLDFDTEGCPDIPVYDPSKVDGIMQPNIDYDPKYNPFNLSKKGDVGGMGRAPLYINKEKKKSSGISTSSLGELGSPKISEDWQTLYDTIKKSASDNEAQTTDSFFPMESGTLFPEEEEQSNVFSGRAQEHLQYRGMYIITQIQDGMMVIDQHRADTRILYEEYMRVWETRISHTQKLIFPETIQFPPSYSSMLDDVISEMNGLGFDIDKTTDREFVVSGIPVGLSGLDACTLVNDLVGTAVEYGSTVKEKVNSILALELARRVATPYGEVLSQDSMESIVCRLLECRNCRYTPDGKNIIGVIRHGTIESLLG